jgi:hypothetical protein
MTDQKFTKLVGEHILNAKGFYDWGIEKKLLDHEKLWDSIYDRRKLAVEMVESGMSQRQVAKLLDVSQSTVRDDVSKSHSKSSRTYSERQAREDANKAELTKPRAAPGIAFDLHCGDFAELSASIADKSVSLIFTDPPYDKQSVALYGKAAEIAVAVRWLELNPPRDPIALNEVRRRAYAELDEEDRVNQRPAHVHIDRDVYNNESDIHVRPSGTSAAAALRRLRKHRPDIHARVLAGEISANAGMVEAGFRKKRVYQRKLKECPFCGKRW